MKFIITTNINEVRNRQHAYVGRVEQAVVQQVGRLTHLMANDIKEWGPEGVAGTYKNPFVEVLPNYQGTLVTGKVGIKAPHAQPTEIGFKAHGFPYQNLIPWVRKTLGITDKTKARKAAYFIAKKFKRERYPGHKIFRQLIQKWYPDVSRLIFFAIQRVK